MATIDTTGNAALAPYPIPLHIQNFRDFGGYATHDGRRVKTGLLFRSGDTSKALDADLAALSELGIVHAVDLRGSSERAAAPARWHDGAKIAVTGGETAHVAPPHLEGVHTEQSAADIRAEMTERYRDLPFRTYLADIYGRYLRLLAETDAGTLVFCTAGKDRTGVIVAIAQLLLGVSQDNVVRDYLLTNSAPGQAQRIAALRDQLELRFGKGLTPEAVQVIVGVEENFLVAALDEIIARHGSISRYARDVLKIEDSILHKLRDKYTA